MRLLHFPVRQIVRASAVLGLSLACLPSAHALFEDAEARRAILELRQRFDASAQENAQMRRSLLDLQAQIETLRSDLAHLQGQNEQLAREANDLAKGVDERMSRFEPTEVQIDGLQFTASPRSALILKRPWRVFAQATLPMHARLLRRLSTPTRAVATSHPRVFGWATPSTPSVTTKPRSPISGL